MATIFNATEYLALYPELAQFGLNADNVYAAHYVPYGAAELRAPNNELAGKIYPASVLAYANGNPELAEAFGVTAPATELTATQQADLVLHYVNYGNAEERANKLVDAPVEEDEVPVTDLVEALVAYQNAAEDEVAVVKAAAEKLNVDNNAKAVETAVDDSVDALNTNVTILPGNFVASSASAKAAALTAAETQLTAEVELAKLDLSAQEQGRVIRFEQTKANVKAAAADNAAANTALVNQVSLVNANAPTTQGTFANSVDFSSVTAAVGSVTVTITIGNKGVSVVGTGGDAAANAAAEATVRGWKGYNEVVASLQAVNKAGTASDKAVDAFVTAAAQLNALDATTAGTLSGVVVDNDATTPAGFVAATVTTSLGTAIKGSDLATLASSAYTEIDAIVLNTTTASVTGATANPLANNAEALSGAQSALSQLELLSEAYYNAVAEFAKVEAAQKSTAEARDVLVEEFEVNPIILGAATAEVATRGDDLFVYTEDAEEVEIFGFNEVGEDSVFFGSQFTWTVLEAGADITKAGNGDRDVLEILALQNGDDLVLYVETDAAGGTVLGEENINTITLAGVNIDDVDFSAGFLTGAVA